MKNWSLKWQILLLVLTAVTIAVSCLTVLTVGLIWEQLDESLVQKAVSISAIVAENLGPGLESQDSVYIAESVQAVFYDEDVHGIVVYDADFREVYRSMADEQLADFQDTCAMVDEVEISHVGNIDLVEYPIFSRGKQVGCMWLAVTEDSLTAQVRKSIIVTVTGAVILLFLAALVGVVVSRRVVRPIKTFVQAATRISSGDMVSTIDLPVLHRDFLQLGTAFNDMQAALGEAFRQLEESRDNLEIQVNERTKELREELKERQKVEAALQEGQELLRATLESTADGILAVNSEGRVTHANARFAEIWHIPDEVLQTRDDDKLLAHVLDQLVEPSKFLEKVRQLYDSSTESLDTLYFKDGRVFERFSCPLKQDDEVVGRVWSFRDITDRVRAIEKLQFTQFSVDHAADPAFWMKKDAKIFYVNDAACRVLGYTREELLTMSVHDIDPNFPTEAWPTYWSSIEERGSLTIQSAHQKNNGDVFPVEITANYVVFEGQAYNCTFARDITDRKRAEHAQSVLLRVSEASNEADSMEELLETVRTELGALIDTKNFYVALYDRENDLYLFPYSRDEFDGKDFAPQELRTSLTDYVRRTGQPLLADETIHRQLEEHGEVGLVGHPSAIWLGVPLKTSSGTTGVMVIQHYTDPAAYSPADLDWLMSVAGPIARVIERMRAEEQERDLREQLERADRMKSLGLLAGGVAHDLNNMLGPLVGYPELMLMKLPEDSPLRKQVMRIGNAAREAAEVVQDLLTLARRGRYNMVPTDLNETIDAYLDSPGLAQLLATRPEVSITTSLGRGIGRILGSSPHLSKVVMNLVVNAFDAMPEGGEIHITTSQGYVDKLLSGYSDIERGEYVLLRVRDIGMGIETEDIDKLFEPYYSKKKMGTSGSGLGLAVVYGVVKDHKGYYDIISTVGEGTEFILHFPVTQVAIEKDSGPAIDFGGTETVLVVDDDPAQREMAMELIGSFGYPVATADNGHDAVEYVRDNSVDIVIMDMIMEKGFDGLDTYRQIIKLHPGQKAIIVSGFSSTDRVVQMQKLGAGQYIKKPYTRRIIAEAIRKELDRPADSTGHRKKTDPISSQNR